MAHESDVRDEERISHGEGVLDEVQREVTEFLGKIMLKRLPVDVSERARRLLRVTDELESISDAAMAILNVTRRLRDNGQRFSMPSQQILIRVHDRVVSFAEEVSSRLKSPRPPFDLVAVQAESRAIGELVRKCRQVQLHRIGTDDPNSPMRVLVELDVLNAYERVRACYLNIAETLAGGKA